MVHGKPIKALEHKRGCICARVRVISLVVIAMLSQADEERGLSDAFL